MQKFTLLVLFSVIAAACSKPSDSNNFVSKDHEAPAVVLAAFDKKIAEHWRLIYRMTSNVSGSQSFRELQNEYPQYLSKFDPAVVNTAELNVSEYVYVGVHTCADQDPRLTFRNGYYDVCFKPSGNMCEVSVLAMPVDRDPCATP